MAVDPVVQDFIARSVAENNRSLMSEISTLITNSVESIKRSNSEAVEDQLSEIKKIRREEPKSFKRKGNEVQYKFNAKIQDSIDEAKSYLESNAVDKAKEFGGGGGVLPYKRLMGMCRWMGSHFHDWID